MLGIMSWWESLLVFFTNDHPGKRGVSLKRIKRWREGKNMSFFFAFSNKGGSLWLLFPSENCYSEAPNGRKW